MFITEKDTDKIYTPLDLTLHELSNEVLHLYVALMDQELQGFKVTCL